MEEALNAEKKIITAEKAVHGIYFCIECGEKVHLRRMIDKAPHFYHYKYNEICTLSIKSNNSFFNVDDIINILKSKYKERWSEAINKLIKYDFLEVLTGKDWALNPLDYYMNKYFNIIDKNTFFKLLSTIISIDNEKSEQLLYKFIVSNKLSYNEKKYLIECTLKNNRPINIETFEYIVNNIELSNSIMFEIIYKKMGSMEYNKLLKESKCEYLIFASKLLKSFIKNRNEDGLYVEFLNIKEKHYKFWSEAKKMFF